ncbi:MAG: hypothetical protein JST24_02215 [Acidobacteria bacterium]|nr:hypothetical protein [Acidobacteriota bacterium]
MAVSPIKLNLVPEPSLWRERHLPLGWAALALGAAVFLGISGYTAWSYLRASQAGQAAVSADAQTQRAAGQERQLLSQLQQIDVDQELPRWRLAERILSERAAPWSRLAAELEQSLVDGARIKNMERARSADQTLLLKVKAEARSRDAEAGFIENLRKDPVFTQVTLEREAQQPGGGWEFDLSLPVTPLPPPFAAADSGKHGKEAQAAPSKPAPIPATRAAVPAPEPRVTQPKSEPHARSLPASRGQVSQRPAPSGLRRIEPSSRRPAPGEAP